MLFRSSGFSENCFDIDRDAGRQVEEALGRKPLRPIRLMSPKPFLRFNFQWQRGLPITSHHDRLLKLRKLACLRLGPDRGGGVVVTLSSAMFEKTGMGKKRKQDELRQDPFNVGNQIIRKRLGDSGFHPIAGLSFSI